MDAHPMRSQTGALRSTIKFRSVKQDMRIGIDCRRRRGGSDLASCQKARPARRDGPAPPARERPAPRNVDGVDVDLDVGRFGPPDEGRQAEEAHPFAPFALDRGAILAFGQRHREVGIAMQEPHLIVEAPVRSPLTRKVTPRYALEAIRIAMETPATARRMVTESRATSMTRRRLSDLGSKASIRANSAAFDEAVTTGSAH